jgi:hypothetical protein
MPNAVLPEHHTQDGTLFVDFGGGGIRLEALALKRCYISGLNRRYQQLPEHRQNMVQLAPVYLAGAFAPLGASREPSPRRCAKEHRLLLADASGSGFQLATVLALNLTGKGFAAGVRGFAHPLAVNAKLKPPDIAALFE